MSYLHDALSLSKSGGIYFEGARVASDERQVVLFVGLGGTGADALIRIKNQVTNRMKLPADPDTGMPVAELPTNIAFLAIDTDNAAEKKTCGNTRFASHGKEFLSIGVVDTAAAIMGAKAQKSGRNAAYQWLDDNLSANGGSAGAGGIRQVGRLLLFENVDAIYQKLQNTIRALAADNPTAAQLQIIVFAGISGGTGSGTFLDMGYLCGQVGRSVITQTSVMGYFVMPDVNETNGARAESLRTNGFASLKELDYLLMLAERNHTFHQVYSSSVQVNATKPPYDFCHIINGSDTQGHVFHYDKIMQSLAENAFAYVAGEVAGNAPAMKSMYDNIAGYRVANAGLGYYPAGNHYLSVGAAMLRIPYTEIATLLACRMFLNLDSTMFQNTPNEMSFFQDGNADVRALNYNEEGFSGYLVQDGPARPDLTAKAWKYEDIWGPVNKAFNTTLAPGGYIATYQAAMAPRTEPAVGVFEGNLVSYINKELRSPQRGPIYLRRMVDSTENPSLIPLLRSLEGRFNGVVQTCVNNRPGLSQKLENAFGSGRKPGLFGKGKVIEAYLQALNDCVVNEENWYRYSCMRDLAQSLVSRLSLYRDRILKPLADALEQMPPIFRENLNVLTVQEEDARKEPDPSLLIYPLDFERRYSGTFQECVERATNGFMNSLASNLQYWVGRDINNVDDDIAHGEDITGFLSKYVSESFAVLYNSISMETIMQAVMGNNVTLDDYAQKKVQELFNTSYSMFKTQNGGAYPTSEFSILSLPTGNPQMAAAVNGLPIINTPQVTKKNSMEANCVYVVRVGAGYPLYGNAFIGDPWEKAYENSRRSGLVGMHLYPEWANLPSPYVECSWPTTYRSEMTAERNARIRADFDYCVEKGVLTKDVNPDGTCISGTLLLADTNVDLDNVILSGSLFDRKNQLGAVQGSLWDPRFSQSVRLEKSSQYQGSEGDPDLNNLRENLLRYPDLCQALAEQRSKLEKIERMQRDLNDPQFFSWALLCENLRRRPGTNDYILLRQEGDPMPVIVVKGTEDTSHEDGWQKVYTEFINLLDLPNSRDNWRQIIEQTLRNRQLINAEDPEKLEQFRQRAAGLAQDFRAAEKNVRNIALTKIGDKSKYLSMADNYGFIAEGFEAQTV